MKRLSNIFHVFHALVLCACMLITSCVEEQTGIENETPYFSVDIDYFFNELRVGESLTIPFTISPSDAIVQMLWTSSDPSVATVVDGVITAVNVGETEITLMAYDQYDHTYTTSFLVCVIPAVFDFSNVSPELVTATTARFTGHLEAPLLSCRVSIYYSDAESFELNTAKSVSVTELDDKQNFIVTLTDLKPGTKYNYCIIVDNNSVQTSSEICNFTTEIVHLSDLVLVPGHFEAEIKGFVTGLSAEDMEYIKVGVLYSSELSAVETGEGSEVNLEEFSSDGSFTILLSNLSVDTKYYYRGYINHGNQYTYGVTAEFTLKHPYEASSDLNVSSAIDLSIRESANCYIVSSPGVYKFKTLQGANSTSVGNVNSAEILWETFGTLTPPKMLDLISAFCYKDDYIVFKTSDVFKEGNAVIAAKDDSGTILWSWHIWFTDEPEGQKYYNDAGIMMDRNLGATSATPGDVGTFGLLYQWGRKDPFLGIAEYVDKGFMEKVAESESTITWPSTVDADLLGADVLHYVTANPTTLIGGFDWSNSEKQNIMFATWYTDGVYKSKYDPCPAGWRVPKKDVWEKASNSSNNSFVGSYDDINKGINFSGKFGPDVTIWYPSAGYRYLGYGSVRGDFGGYWATTYGGSGRHCRSFALEFDEDGRVRTCVEKSVGDLGCPADTYSVRCIQE